MRVFLLILAIFSIPCVVRSEEFDWRPVTQLRAVIEDVELVTKTGTRKATGIIVTGLISADQFKSNDARNAKQPYLKDAELDPVDYRYRARIEYRNPGYQKDDDPFVASGLTRSTPWSVPTAAVKLPLIKR